MWGHDFAEGQKQSTVRQTKRRPHLVNLEVAIAGNVNKAVRTHSSTSDSSGNKQCAQAACVRAEIAWSPSYATFTLTNKPRPALRVLNSGRLNLAHGTSQQ